MKVITKVFKSVQLYVKFFLMILSIVMTVLSSNAYAKKSLNCATTHYPPYTIYNSENRSFSGLDMKVINALSTDLGIKFKVDNLPWARLKNEISKGRYDCYFSLGKFLNREKHLDYTSTPMHVTKVAIFHKGSKPIEQINFKNKEIGVHRGINLHKEIRLPSNFNEANIRKINSNESLFHMFELNRLEAVITSYEVGKHLLSNGSYKTQYSVFIVEGYELPVYLAFTKGRVELEKINVALEKQSENTNLPQN